MRELLTANRNYFILVTGSDANTGLVNNAGGAWLTLQHAMDIISQTLDVAGFTVTVQVGDGTYTANLKITNWEGGGVVLFQGNSVTPANVFVNVTGNCIDASFGVIPGIFRVKDMKLKASAFNIVSRSVGRLQFTNLVFDTGVGHVVSAGAGLIEPYGTSLIIGAASAGHFITDVQGTINATAADLPSAFTGYTLTGTLAFGTFALSQGAGNITMAAGATFTGGTITGKRYSAVDNSIIKANGGTAAFFPGSVAGTVATGGVYN